MSRGRFSLEGSVGLGFLSVLALMVLGAAPAFAWTHLGTTRPGPGTTTRTPVVLNGVRRLRARYRRLRIRSRSPRSTQEQEQPTARRRRGGEQPICASVTFGGLQLTGGVQSFVNNDAEFWYLTNPSGTEHRRVDDRRTSVVVGAYALSGWTRPTDTTSATAHGTSGTLPYR